MRMWFVLETTTATRHPEGFRPDLGLPDPFHFRDFAPFDTVAPIATSLQRIKNKGEAFPLGESHHPMTSKTG